VLGAATKAIRGPVALRRWVLATADAWYALGPATVLVLADAQLPDWDNWPIYVVALVVQLVLDAAIAVGRAGLSFGIPPREVLGEMVLVHRVDALLAPIGLLAALAAAPVPGTALLVLPLVGLLGVLSREREARIARTLELGQAYRGTALLLRDLLEEEDEYTGRHSQDVVRLSVRVTEALGCGEEVRRETELGAMLHDIGKIAIPSTILNKPGRLDAREWAVMQTHTVEGQRMLNRIGGLLGRVGLIVRASHERWDGGGYPDGLAQGGDPARRADRVRVRRLQRDDDAPALPLGDAARRRDRRARGRGGPPVRSARGADARRRGPRPLSARPPGVRGARTPCPRAEGAAGTRPPRRRLTAPSG
jgi:hypothetical protein